MVTDQKCEESIDFGLLCRDFRKNKMISTFEFEIDRGPEPKSLYGQSHFTRKVKLHFKNLIKIKYIILTLILSQVKRKKGGKKRI